MQYSTNIDDKEDNFKVLYLYDVFQKTQGMGEELNILQQYLAKLSKVQQAMVTAVPVGQLI